MGNDVINHVTSGVWEDKNRKSHAHGTKQLTGCMQWIVFEIGKNAQD
jgi:hypothetical protein